MENGGRRGQAAEDVAARVRAERRRFRFRFRVRPADPNASLIFARGRRLRVSTRRQRGWRACGIERCRRRVPVRLSIRVAQTGQISEQSTRTDMYGHEHNTLHVLVQYSTHGRHW